MSRSSESRSSLWIIPGEMRGWERVSTVGESSNIRSLGSLGGPEFPPRTGSSTSGFSEGLKAAFGAFVPM